MEIKYIQEFVVLTEVGNFLEASSQLFISQSSLSRHIKSIEEELGVPLFDRTTRSVKLNKYGKLFLPFAREISTLQYGYTSAFYNELKQSRQTVTIGSIPSMAQYNITSILTRFHKENYSFALNMIEADTLILGNMLKEEKCDFAFIRGDELSDESLVKIPYTIDKLTAILPAGHRFANKKSLYLKDLKHEDFILLSENTYMYKLCIQVCEQAGFTPKVFFTCQRGDNIVDMVSKGIGVSLLTKKPTSSIANANISIVDIFPPITTSIYLAYDKKHVLSPAGKHFLTFFNHVISEERANLLPE